MRRCGSCRQSDRPIHRVIDLSPANHCHNLKLAALLQGRFVEPTSWHDLSIELHYYMGGLNVELLEKVGYRTAGLDDARLTVCGDGDCAWVNGFVHRVSPAMD